MSSLQSTGSMKGKWRTLLHLQSKSVHWCPVLMGKSIWISASNGAGSNVISEFCCETDTMKGATNYHDFKADHLSMCGPESNGKNGKLSLIAVVDGKNGKLLLFDTVTRKYGAAITIPKLGYYTSAVMIDGTVHIMHGSDDAQCKYVVYSLKTGKIKEFTETHQNPKLYNVSILKSGTSNLFFKFGGGDMVNKKIVDSFFMGTLSNGDTSRPISWMTAKQFQPPKPFYGCGVIQYDQYIIIFGGTSTSKMLLDGIYILDTDSKTGWIQSPIRCPIKSLYLAVLDHKARAHLFTRDNDNKQHYCIAVNDLVSSLDVSASALPSPLRSARSPKHSGDDDQKFQYDSSENTKLKNMNEKLKSLNKKQEEQLKVLRGRLRERLQKVEESLKVNVSLKEEVTRARGESEVHLERRKESRKQVNELKSTILTMNNTADALKATISELEQKNAALHSVNAATKEDVETLKVKLDALASENGRLETENKRLKDEAIVHQDEQKESQMQIAELQEKVKTLELRALRVSEFMDWDWKETLFWITWIGDKKFKKYEESLETALSGKKFSGKKLLDVTELVIEFWGIDDEKDRKELNDYIQNLKQQHGPNKQVAIVAAADVASKENEGAPTAFM